MLKRILKRFWAWTRAGWGPVSGLGVVFSAAKRGWHWLGNLDLLKSVFEMAGIGVPTLIKFVSGPFFGVGLIAVGLVGFSHYAEKGQTNLILEKVWRVSGWTIFCAALCAIVSTFWFSSMATNSGILSAKNTQFINRVFSEKQVNGIKAYVCPLKQSIGPVSIVAIDDPYVLRLGNSMLSILKSCGYKFEYFENEQLTSDLVTNDDPDKHGIFVAVLDKSHPDPKSKALLSALNTAGIPAQFSEWEDINKVLVPFLKPTIYFSNP